MKRYRILGICIVFLLVLTAFAPSQQKKKQDKPDKKEVSQKDIDDAIANGIKYLKKKQAKEGFWSYEDYYDVGNFQLPGGIPTKGKITLGMYDYGTTAIAVYTLIKSGVSIEDESIKKGLKVLLDTKINQIVGRSVYEVSLALIALSYAEPKLKNGKTGVDSIKKKMKELTDYLVKAQHNHGGWGYGEATTGHYDNSNTQFAILGLRAAKNAGIDVPKQVWERTLNLLTKGQSKDGGWGYICPTNAGRTGINPQFPEWSSPSTNTMTAAGLMCVYICKSTLAGDKKIDVEREKILKTGFERLKKYKIDSAMAFSNGLGLGYWLYSLERACMIADVKKLGDIDWYKEGAKILVGEQSDNGGWGNTVQYNPRTRQTEKQETGGYVVDTCFALLFLRKAFVGIGIETPSSRGKDSERPKGIETK